MFKKKTWVFIGLIILLATGGLSLMFSENTFVSNLNPFTEQGISLHSETWKENPNLMECLVKTGDNIGTDDPIDERAGNYKQGYIVLCKEPYFEQNEKDSYYEFRWGSNELDPKRFVIIRINKEEYNSSWIEPEYDGEGNILTRRKYKLPLESFLTPEELDDIKNISFNEDVNWTIKKNLTDIQDLITEVSYDSKKVDFVTHGSAGTFYINTSGGNYTTLAGWESGEQVDLTGTGPCIAIVNEGFEDTTALTINGFTTTGADYVEVRVDESFRHGGILNMSAFRMNVSDNTIVYIFDDHVNLTGLQLIKNSSNANGQEGVGVGAIAVGGVTHLSNLLIKQDDTTTRGNRGILVNDAEATVYIWNTIMYDIGSATTSDNTCFRSSASLHVYLYNVLCDGGFRGIYQTGGTVTVKNTIAFNSTLPSTDFSGTFTSNSTHNIAGDGTAPGSEAIAGIPLFVDIQNDDYHLSADDTIARDNGTDLSSDDALAFMSDIDLDDRDATWDRGPDEYVSAAPPDLEYPIFSGYLDNNGTLTDSGTGTFNVTLLSTNGTVQLEINGVNVTANNNSGNGTEFNATYAFTSSGTYLYRWNAFGNGTSTNYNVSSNQSYTVNASADTCSPTSPLIDNHQFECSDNCDTRYLKLDANGYKISVNGTGFFIFNYTGIFNFSDFLVRGQDSSNKCEVYNLG